MAVTNLNTGDTITEAWVDSVSGRLNGTTGDAGTTYTPTLTQSGSVSKTTTRATYRKVGRQVWGDVILTCTGSGTGSNVIVIGLPVATATSSASSILGSGYIFDTSASQYFAGCHLIYAGSTTAHLFYPNGTLLSRLGDVSFTAGLATGDVISLNFSYESAS